MAQTWLPGDTRQRIQDLIKDSSITQAELAGICDRAGIFFIEEQHTVRLVHCDRQVEDGKAFFVLGFPRPYMGRSSRSNQSLVIRFTEWAAFTDTLVVLRCMPANDFRLVHPDIEVFFHKINSRQDG